MSTEEQINLEARYYATRDGSSFDEGQSFVIQAYISGASSMLPKIKEGKDEFIDLQANYEIVCRQNDLMKEALERIRNHSKMDVIDYPVSIFTLIHKAASEALSKLTPENTVNDKP